MRNYHLTILFKVLALSETFGRSDQPWTLPSIPGYLSWRVERGGGDKGGGGLCLLYRESLTPHLWKPPVADTFKYVENERQWFLIDNGVEKLALLHCYLACQSTKSDDFLKWNEDLFQLMTMEITKLGEQGFVTLCMGDFNSRVGRLPGLGNNTPDINKNGPMFMNFVTQANLVILNTLPITKGLFTRFMNSSGLPGSMSLLDYGLIDADNVHAVSSFTIDSDARFSCGSDHALLIAKLVFGSTRSVTWDYKEVLKFNFTPKTDFSKYRAELDKESSSVPLHLFSDLSAEEKLHHVTHSVLQAGKRGIGLMTKKKKPRKLPRDLIERIKAKNLVASQINNSRGVDNQNLADLQTTLMQMKAEIRNSIVSMKLNRRFKLRSKLLTADPTRKKFWRFLKNQMKVAGSVTGAYDSSGQMVFQQHEIEDAVLEQFSKIFQGQRSPVFSSPDHPDMVAMSIQDIDNILAMSPSDVPEDRFEGEVCSQYSLSELSQTLASLPNEKAAGVDQIPNELLKNSSCQFKQYLLLFLNHMISDGKVPDELNQGKCMLIHKVNVQNHSSLVLNSLS